MQDAPARRGRPPTPAAVRVLGKVIIAPSGCWEYTGKLKWGGYGLIRVGGKDRRAHRVVYEALIGPIPPDLVIDHLCFNKRCVNPMHMEVVTPGENTRRAWRAELAKAPRKRRDPATYYRPPPLTECQRGHPFDEENTIHRPNGRRACRACSKSRDARAYARRKAKTLAARTPR